MHPVGEARRGSAKALLSWLVSVFTGISNSEIVTGGSRSRSGLDGGHAASVLRGGWIVGSGLSVAQARHEVALA